MRTPIWNTVPRLLQLTKEATPEQRAIWGDEYLKLAEPEAVMKNLNPLMQDPDKVVRALRHAITSSRPQPRYLVGWDAKYLLAPIAALPTAWGDAILRILMPVPGKPVGFRA
mmetsp:Transcript_63186/g.137404  ORF Transcript_63186/g.137404 Transcript_63186/m.137404 type:complete len:112 (+) Transcript_63186:51-386(+)